MKKLLLSGSALMLFIASANAQTPGTTSASAYDDFSGNYQPANQRGIFYWRGQVADATDVRDEVTGKETFTYTAEHGAVYLEVNFGNDGATTPVPFTLNCSTMADVEVDIENLSSTKDLTMRVVLTDINNKYTEIEPNLSDLVGVSDEATIIPNLTWAGLTEDDIYPLPSNLDAVYPRKAYNGFVLKAATRRTIRIDLSSAAGAIGGLKWSSYTGGNPNTMPATTYDFDPSQVKNVQFIFNEGWGDPRPFSDHAMNEGSHRFDAEAQSQDNYTGALVLRSFKIGNVLAPLDPIPTAITDAAVDGSLKAYPNPAKETLNVTFESTSGTTVSLTDIVGNTVYTTSANAGANEIRMNTSNFTKGVYILNVTTEKGKATRKVSIQ
ncbi:MAG: T9SS type A sorting domain-containing protein [Cytophagaceae bacterium]|nr:T9SS type A sorting domain-containing protein [Cytophagaceae bacterium]